MTLPDAAQTPAFAQDGTDNWSHVRVPTHHQEHVTARATASSDEAEETYSFSSVSDWQPGACVFAPWEPAFRYVGAIRQVKEDQALVDFADGGSGWVHLHEIRPFELQPEQIVACRREDSPFYFPGKILELRADEARVRFEDGFKEWVKVACIRVAAEAIGKGAKVVEPAGWQEFYDCLAVGVRIWAPWNASELFAGTVTKLREDKVHIAFDDGDEGWVQRAQVLPLAIPRGLRVYCKRWLTEGYDAARVIAVDGATLEVRYENGKPGWVKLADVGIPCAPTGPSARATKVAWRIDVTVLVKYWPIVLMAVIVLFLLISCLVTG